MTPAASIIIPAYNAQDHVAQAIESALEQGPEVEVIVVDDGSRDQTAARIQAYEAHITFHTGENRGAPAARNTGLHLARAPWVQFLDADDYLLPGKIPAQLTALKDRPDVDVLYGQVTVEWADRMPVQHTWSPMTPPLDPFVLLALWRLSQTGAPLWRKQALMDVGGWREDQPCCQEHELFLRLLMAGKRFEHHEAAKGAVYRRFDTGTLSTSNQAKVRKERAKIEDRLEAYLDAAGLMTPERQQAIDQARFDMARSAWSEDRAEARRHHAAIRGPGFTPQGGNAPPIYQKIYRTLGFEWAEHTASLRRALRARKGLTP